MKADGIGAATQWRRGALGIVIGVFLASVSHAAEKVETTSDAELRARIEAQLGELPDRVGAEIRVAVRDGQVVLQGKVRLLDQSLRAERTVWKTAGVRDVDNELQIAPSTRIGDSAIERQVRMLIKGGERFVDTSLEITVSAGVVELRGLFRDPSDVLALKHQIASIAGVIDVQIDAMLVALR